MKIALIGSAPSSVRLGPYDNPEWKIWGCSPGVFATGVRTDTWFELHRWEPGVLGRAETQKPWLSPEYCAWMAKHPDVVMVVPQPDIPNSRHLPWQQLITIYGAYFFNSSLSWMAAMAIEAIKTDRERPDRDPDTKDAIGMWGVDMSATEEYGYQRAGCQFFVQMAMNMNIEVIVPPESDLTRHPPLYGVCEHWDQHIKTLTRLRELQQRNAIAKQNIENAQRERDYTQGLMDDTNYHLNTWLNVPEIPGFHLPSVFQSDAERGKFAASGQATSTLEQKGPDLTPVAGSAAQGTRLDLAEPHPKPAPITREDADEVFVDRQPTTGTD